MPKLEQIFLPDGELWYQSGFFSFDESEVYFEQLEQEINWRQEDILMFGKRIPQPRLVAWYGDPGISYSYSSLTFTAEPWSPTLLTIKEAIEQEVDHHFNSVLLNLYRDGQDSMSWHSDDEPELGKKPVIASVSLGGIRRFHFRHKFKPDQSRVRIDLAHGSLLIMKGATQHNWQHQVSKTKRSVSPRINLTFRQILTPTQS